VDWQPHWNIALAFIIFETSLSIIVNAGHRNNRSIASAINNTIDGWLMVADCL